MGGRGEKEKPALKLVFRRPSWKQNSLVVLPHTGFYFWNSRGDHGDVFDFVGRHILGCENWNNRHADQFMESVRWLAERANISLENPSHFGQLPAWAERQLVQRLHDHLLKTPGALEYVTQKRGWQLSTVKAARIGYMPQDKRPLLSGLSLPEHWYSLIQKFPSGLIIYVHLEKGRLVYLSGRSVKGKQHYNPPRDLIGARQPCYNQTFDGSHDYIVIVEGQADAISFAEWGIPALALGRMQLSESLLETLRSYRRVFIALDNTDDAHEQSNRIGQVLGGKAYLPRLPEGVKDANDWLALCHATADQAQTMLNRAQSWLMREVERVSHLEGLAQEDAIRDLFQHASDLDVFSLARFKTTAAKLGIQGRAFDRLLKAGQAQNKDGDTEGEATDVFNDNIPVLSPALGFSRGLALVTVSLRERMKNNRLNIQPYLVTGTRELIRLKDQQILTTQRPADNTLDLLDQLSSPRRNGGSAVPKVIAAASGAV